MLKLIKTIHTIIWAIMASATFYILYSGIMNTFDILLFISLGLLVVETLVLIFNGWVCPLTPLARKHTAENDPNFDIYLPVWLAKHNKVIFGSIFAVGSLLVLMNLVFR